MRRPGKRLVSLGRKESLLIEQPPLILFLSLYLGERDIKAAADVTELTVGFRLFIVAVILLISRGDL